MPEGYAGPHGIGALLREGRVVGEGVRLVRRSRRDRRARSGQAYVAAPRPTPVEPVLLVPGFMAGDATLALMARELRRAGYRTYRSSIHVNMGCTREAAERLERRVESIALRRGRPVTIVGHSLGGMLARGLAVRRPDLIDAIVTMGSPVLAPGAVHGLLVTNVDILNRLTRAGIGGLMSEDCTSGECAQQSFTEMQAPLEDSVAFTAIWSPRDGIVDSQACRDPRATQVEVASSHCGMAVDPAVVDAVLAALADARVSRASRRGDRRAMEAALPDARS